MSICAVEKPEMNSLSVCETYAYMSYVETTLPAMLPSKYTEEDAAPPPAVVDLERPLLFSAPRLPCNFKLAFRSLHGDPALNGAAISAGTRLDIPAYLPPEISVHIFRFLHPRHLCRVVLVSKKWYRLAQCGSLRARRLRYVQYKRDKFLQSKENMALQQRHPGRTPHTLTRSSLSSRGNSPLTSIQSSRSRHRHSTRARHSPLSGSTTRDGETPLRLPRSQHHSFYRCSERHITGSPLLETPDNSDFDVRVLAQVMEDEAAYLVRRCLFPYSDAPVSKPNRPHYSSPANDDTTAMDTGLVIKKSASKRRLKRL